MRLCEHRLWNNHTNLRNLHDILYPFRPGKSKNKEVQNENFLFPVLYVTDPSSMLLWSPALYSEQYTKYQLVGSWVQFLRWFFLIFEKICLLWPQLYFAGRYGLLKASRSILLPKILYHCLKSLIDTWPTVENFYGPIEKCNNFNWFLGFES